MPTSGQRSTSEIARDRLKATPSSQLARLASRKLLVTMSPTYCAARGAPPAEAGSDAGPA